MVDTSIHFKNYRDFRKESILIVLFKPVFRFKRALLHKDLKTRVPLSYSNLRDNLGMRSA
jgi:hypothetical protein